MTTNSHHLFPTPFSKYQEMYKQSMDVDFFNKQDLIKFQGDFNCKKNKESFSFEIDGFLNASYNCIDRHPTNNPAIYWETDEPNPNASENTLTFGQLQQLTSQLANALVSLGVVKGDRVGICTGQTPYAVISMLACARIGAIHVVIFAGFSSEAIKDRLKDVACKVVICTDIGKRGSKSIPIFQTMSKAIPDCVEHVIIALRPSSCQQLLNIHFDPSFDHATLLADQIKAISPLLTHTSLFWHDIVVHQSPYAPPVTMHAEDPLFILHTSGSTGKPKGLVHTTGGYLIGAAYTTRLVFDLQPNNVFGCMADCGWITGHTYIVYGPLSIGCTSVIFEPTPTYPSPLRYVDTILKWGIHSFYTAPTAIRLLKKLNNQVGHIPTASPCKVLGSVGEPINPETWQYYQDEFGNHQCAVVDTYWQTETGSIIITPIPHVITTKPGSATFPFLGINAVLLDPETLAVLDDATANEGLLAIKEPWPSMARTIYKDHTRYLKTYIKNGMYITGDTAYRDVDGYIWIRGRVDDVVNVAGHRLSTAEVESAMMTHPDCSEAASIGISDELYGQAIMVFVVPKYGSLIGDEGFKASLILKVRELIGPIATPKYVVIVKDLPKTRSGKLMRRLLRQLVEKWMGNSVVALGDCSTLADISVLGMIEEGLAATEKK